MVLPAPGAAFFTDKPSPDSQNPPKPDVFCIADGCSDASVSHTEARNSAERSENGIFLDSASVLCSADGYREGQANHLTGTFDKRTHVLTREWIPATRILLAEGVLRGSLFSDLKQYVDTLRVVSIM